MSDDKQTTDFLAGAEVAGLRGDWVIEYQCLRAAVRELPGDAEGWDRLGVLLGRLQAWPAAVAAFRRALGLRPGDHRVLTNLGVGLSKLGRFEEAVRVGDLAYELASGAPEPSLVLSQVFYTTGDFEGALGMARDAVAKGGGAIAHTQLAFCLLRTGRWLEGFREYEHRFEYKLPEYRRYPFALWRGERTGTLMVVAEQGLGDSVMMMRFLPECCRRAERVRWYVRQEFRGLAADVVLDMGLGNVELVPMPAAFGQADAFIPMMSLPVALEDDGTGKVPYIFAHPERGAGPPELLDRRGDWNIGICWAGSSAHENSHFRDIPLEEMLRLAEAPGVRLFSLQVGDRHKDLAAINADALVVNLAGWLSDMADTVSIMGELDLVITCDTAVAHLAGAMGRECWVLLNQRNMEWRWSEEMSPWYPSVRVMWRGLGEEWGTLMARVTEELAAWKPGA